MKQVTRLAGHRHRVPPKVFFDRKELDKILRVYGRMVVAGTWRDYAIDDDPEQVTFSIYRRASEMPLYRIVKCPEWESKQGTFAILSYSGQVLKRGKDLEQLLRFFESKKLEVV